MYTSSPTNRIGMRFSAFASQNISPEQGKTEKVYLDSDVVHLRLKCAVRCLIKPRRSLRQVARKLSAHKLFELVLIAKYGWHTYPYIFSSFETMTFIKPTSKAVAAAIKLGCRRRRRARFQGETKFGWCWDVRRRGGEFRRQTSERRETRLQLPLNFHNEKTSFRRLSFAIVLASRFRWPLSANIKAIFPPPTHPLVSTHGYVLLSNRRNIAILICETERLSC